MTNYHKVWPVAGSVPAKIQGKEILWYIINILKINNFNHIILPLGYKGRLIRKFIYNNQSLRLNVELIDTGIKVFFQF